MSGEPSGIEADDIANGIIDCNTPLHRANVWRRRWYMTTDAHKLYVAKEKIGKRRGRWITRAWKHDYMPVKVQFT